MDFGIGLVGVGVDVGKVVGTSSSVLFDTSVIGSAVVPTDGDLDGIDGLYVDEVS